MYKCQVLAIVMTTKFKNKSAILLIVVSLLSCDNSETTDLPLFSPSDTFTALLIRKWSKDIEYPLLSSEDTLNLFAQENLMQNNSVRNNIYLLERQINTREICDSVKFIQGQVEYLVDCDTTILINVDKEYYNVIKFHCFMGRVNDIKGVFYICYYVRELNMIVAYVDYESEIQFCQWVSCKAGELEYNFPLKNILLKIVNSKVLFPY